MERYKKVTEGENNTKPTCCCVYLLQRGANIKKAADKVFE